MKSMALQKDITKTTAALVSEIREIVRTARAKAFQAVNFAMVEAYWLIGKRIVEEEQKGRVRAQYGEQLVGAVSRQLTTEFCRGFSEANVWNFRQFYLTYPSEKILYTLRRELSWSRYRLIMRLDTGSCRAPLEHVPAQSETLTARRMHYWTKSVSDWRERPSRSLFALQQRLHEQAVPCGPTVTCSTKCRTGKLSPLAESSKATRRKRHSRVLRNN